MIMFLLLVSVVLYRVLLWCCFRCRCRLLVGFWFYSCRVLMVCRVVECSSLWCRWLCVGLFSFG